MVTAIVPGDNVACERVIVSDPLCLLDVPETLPRVSARSGLILRCGTDTATDKAISKNFHGVFRAIPAFAGLDEVEEALMAARGAP
jgi:hypothetical protein